jgi:predicted ester cyclase
MISSRRLGKCRYIVALPIPARRAMSSSGASAPALAEDLSGGGQQQFVIALCIRAAGTPRSLAWCAAGGRAEALALIDADVIDHRGGVSGDHLGLAVWAQKWEHMYDGLEDVSVTIEQNVASGDFSVNRYTLRGTDAVSGRSYQVTGLDMVRVRDGKLVEHWALLDSSAMRHQLGAGADS